MSVVSLTKRRHWFQTLKGKEAISFYLFILPWVIGFLIFTVGPIIVSFFLSFMEYDIILPPKFVGLANFSELFEDPLFSKSMSNTLYIVVLAVPLGMVAAFLMALLLNQKVRGVAVYRTAYFIPSIVGRFRRVVVICLATAVGAAQRPAGIDRHLWARLAGFRNLVETLYHYADGMGFWGNDDHLPGRLARHSPGIL
jgi:ABC-type sugar transport system permease subunit